MPTMPPPIFISFRYRVHRTLLRKLIPPRLALRLSLLLS